jgi:hypothetical protein
MVGKPQPEPFWHVVAREVRRFFQASLARVPKEFRPLLVVLLALFLTVLGISIAPNTSPDSMVVILYVLLGLIVLGVGAFIVCLLIALLRPVNGTLPPLPHPHPLLTDGEKGLIRLLIDLEKGRFSKKKAPDHYIGRPIRVSKERLLDLFERLLRDF